MSVVQNRCMKPNSRTRLALGSSSSWPPPLPACGVGVQNGASGEWFGGAPMHTRHDEHHRPVCGARGREDRGLGAGARAPHTPHYAPHAARAARAALARRLELLARALLCARARTGVGVFFSLAQSSTSPIPPPQGHHRATMGSADGVLSPGPDAVHGEQSPTAPYVQMANEPK